MLDRTRINDVLDRAVFDRDGDKIGDIGQVYTDSDGRPQWASVKTGLFGMKESFVPLDQAEIVEQGLRVPFSKAEVKDAPKIDADYGELSPTEEASLYSHYGRANEYQSWRDQSLQETAQETSASRSAQDQLRLRRYDRGSGQI